MERIRADSLKALVAASSRHHFYFKSQFEQLWKCGNRLLSIQSYTRGSQGSKEQIKTEAWSWWRIWCWCEEIPHLLNWKVLPVFKAATQPHTALNTADGFSQECPTMRVFHTQLLGQWDPQFPDSSYSELMGRNLLADFSLSKTYCLRWCHSGNNSKSHTFMFLITESCWRRNKRQTEKFSS